MGLIPIIMAKNCTYHTFFLFCEEMIRVICAIFAVAIKNLELRKNNKNHEIA